MNFRLGSFLWEASFGIFGLRTSCGNERSSSSTTKLGLESLAWERSSENVAWQLSFMILRDLILGSFA